MKWNIFHNHHRAYVCYAGSIRFWVILWLGLLWWATMMPPFDAVNITVTRLPSMPVWVSFRWYGYSTIGLEPSSSWSHVVWICTSLQVNNLFPFTMSSRFFVQRIFVRTLYVRWEFILNPDGEYQLVRGIHGSVWLLCVDITAIWNDTQNSLYTVYSCHPSTRWALPVIQPRC